MPALYVNDHPLHFTYASERVPAKERLQKCEWKRNALSDEDVGWDGMGWAVLISFRLKLSLLNKMSILWAYYEIAETEI
jgi:hypothetical protein